MTDPVYIVCPACLRPAGSIFDLPSARVRRVELRGVPRELAGGIAARVVQVASVHHYLRSLVAIRGRVVPTSWLRPPWWRADQDRIVEIPGCAGCEPRLREFDARELRRIARTLRAPVPSVPPVVREGWTVEIDTRWSGSRAARVIVRMMAFDEEDDRHHFCRFDHEIVLAELDVEPILEPRRSRTASHAAAVVVNRGRASASKPPPRRQTKRARP